MYNVSRSITGSYGTLNNQNMEFEMESLDRSAVKVERNDVIDAAIKVYPPLTSYETVRNDLLAASGVAPYGAASVDSDYGITHATVPTERTLRCNVYEVGYSRQPATGRSYS